jgi:hypothetical protein
VLDVASPTARPDRVAGLVAPDAAPAEQRDRAVGERAPRGGGAAVTPAETALRAFLARILGYQRTEAVECALRSIHLWVTHCTALVLLGDDESGLVSVARALHRSADGAGRPFIVCDQWSRQPTCSAIAAVQAARGGSLCVRRRRLPIDFPSAVPMLRDPTVSVQLIICASMRFDPDPFLACPVPSSSRRSESAGAS